MTPRGRDALAAIARHLDRHGHGPSEREIGAALGVTGRGPVRALLDQLVREGFITRSAGRRRSIRLTAAGRAALARPDVAEAARAVVAAAQERDGRVLVTLETFARLRAAVGQMGEQHG